MQVVALIEEENGNFGVWFPDFPGCVTGADGLDEAVAKAAQVLAFHAEGLAEDGPLPVPRTLAELRVDPAFRNEAKRAVAVLVPYAPPTHAVRLNITLDESLLQRIDRAAGAAGETRSGYLAQAAKRRLAVEAGSSAGEEVTALAAAGAVSSRPAAKRADAKRRRVFGSGEKKQERFRGKRK